MGKNKSYRIVKQMLALILTLCLVLGLIPAMPRAIVRAATSTGLPREELTSAMAGQTLSSNKIYCVEENVTINGSWNTPGLKVSSTAYIYIAKDCTLTVKGGSSNSNTRGGQPGIYLPSNATLYVTGEGTLKVTGGAGARAGDGGGGGSGAVWQNPDTFRGGDGGNGGRGASGGGAGIGTAGAAGGDGGSGGSGVIYDCDEKDHAGANGGSDGSSGSSSASAGTLLLYGAVKVDASGGSSGSSGSGGSAGGNAQYKWSNTYFAAGGGGGGGGGAAGAASGIGAGGPGGGGGAGGGSGATNYSKNNTYILPGNGGSGGSSGGSSGTTGSSTTTGSNYKKGGSGGSGGGQGNKGSGGTVKKDKDVNIVNMYSTVQSGVGSIVTPPYPTQFTYQVTPDNNKGTGSTEPQGAAISAEKSKVSLGYPVDCSDGWSVPTRVGYTFAGYNEKGDGTGREYVKYYPDAEVGQNFEATGRWNVAGDTIIYAQWSPNPYKVLLDRNNTDELGEVTDSDGSNNTEQNTTGTTEITAHFDQTMPEGIEIPQRVGYTFLGYYEEKVDDDVDDTAINPSNTQYYDKDGKPTTATWTKPEDDHVLYARWKRTTYQIAYEPNGGTYPQDESITKYEYTYGDTYDLPSDVNKAEAKQDYIFEGWYLNDTFTTDQIKTIYPANFGDKKYYAKWTPIKGTRADSELLTVSANTFPVRNPETGDITPGTRENYDHTQVYTQINGRPAEVDRVELRSGSGSDMKSYACATDDTGAYGYYSKGSIGTAKIYVNGRDTGKTVKSDSNAEIALATAKVMVSKDDVLLTGADVQLRRTDADNHEIIHYLTDNEDGTYSYLWLADQVDKEYHIYVNGEDSGKCITLDGGKTVTLSYYTIQVKTKRNDALAEVGPVVIRAGEGETQKELSLTETEKDSGIFEIVSVKDPAIYQVYVDDEPIGQEVSFTSDGRNALQDYYDVEVTTRKDGEPYYIGKVELKSGNTVLAVNGANGKYSVRGLVDMDTSYDIYVDGADSGQDARFTSSERKHTIDYYTVTVNVTRNGEAFNEASGVTLKAPGKSSIPLTWTEPGVYNTVQPTSDTTYHIWFGSENTGRTVKSQPGNNRATIDYYGLTLNLRENGEVIPDAAITLVKDGAIVASFDYDAEQNNYQSQIRGAGTYDIYRNGADTGADFVVSNANKEADVEYYTVSYDGNGADETQTVVAPYLVRAGEMVTITSQRLTKTGEAGAGYKFGGWKCDDDEKVYKARDTFTMPNHAVTLKAVWIANEDCEAMWTMKDGAGNVLESGYGTMDEVLEEAANKYGEVTVSIVKDDASVKVTTSAELKSATKLVIKSGQTLILKDGVSITNRGIIKNNGTISKEGSNAVIQNEANGVIDQSAEDGTSANGTIGCDVTGSGTIGFGKIASGATITGARLWGAIENHGTIINPSELTCDTGEFTNAADGKLNIQTDNSLKVKGALNNQGTLTNEGTLELSEETTLTNQSGAKLQNDGALTAKAMGGKAAHIENVGTINNRANATITMQSMGTQSASMINKGTVENAGVISLTMAATLDTAAGTVTNKDNGYVLAYREVPQGQTITDTMDGETITFQPQVIGINTVTGTYKVVYLYVTTEEQLLESASLNLNGIQLGNDIELNHDLTLANGASLWIPEKTKLEVSSNCLVTVEGSSDGIQLDGTIWMHSKEDDRKLTIAEQKLKQNDTGRIYYQFSASISATEKILGIDEKFVLSASANVPDGGICKYTWYECQGENSTEQQSIADKLWFEWKSDMGTKRYFCRVTWEDTERGVTMKADTSVCTISSKLTTDVSLVESEHVSEVIAEGEATKFGKDQANCGEDWTATIKADTGYQLPEEITVTIGGVRVVANIGYTYDVASGVITVKKDGIRGPILITAKATPITYQIKYHIGDASGRPSLGVKQEDGSYLQTISYEQELKLADIGTLTNQTAIFKGWAETEEATEPEYQPGATLEEHFSNTQDDVKNLYAVWRVKQEVSQDLLKDTTTDSEDPNYGKSLVEIVSANSFVYNGNPQKPKFTLPEQNGEPHFSVSNNGGIDVGIYYVELTLSDQSFEYYQWPEMEGAEIDGKTMRIPYQITQATNAFTTALSCSNVVFGNRLVPSAESQFGFVKYRYRVSGNTAWSNTAPSDAGDYQVQAYVTGTANYTGLESEPVEAAIEKGVYKAPDTSKVKAVDETIEGKKDGRLSGLTTDMEYRKAGENEEWIAITAEVLGQNGPRDLEAGAYEVRYKESDNAEASPGVTLTVNHGRKLVVTYQATYQTVTESGDRVIVSSNVATQETIWHGSVSPNTVEIPESLGYNKDGWSGSYENLETDVTLTAQYESKNIEVKLKPNGGTVSDENTCIYEKYGDGYYDSKGTLMNAISQPIGLPSKTGYTFLGYYTKESGGTCYIGADGMLTKNADNRHFEGTEDETAVLYAHWEMTAYKYSIVKASDADVKISGEGTFKSTIGYDDPRTITVAPVSGTFNGDSIYIYVDGVEIASKRITMQENTATPIEIKVDLKELNKLGNVLVSVGDKPVCHTITYKYADGDHLEGQEITAGMPEDTPYVFLEKSGVYGLVTPIRSGYTFEGWYRTADCSEGEVTTIPARTRTDVTLYAKWTRNTYSIDFDLKGGTISGGKPTEYTYSETETIKLPKNVTRTGYVFKGWYLTSAPDEYQEIPAKMTGDLKFYAKWEEQICKVTKAPADGVTYHTLGTSDILKYGTKYQFSIEVSPAYNGDNRNVSYVETGASSESKVPLTPDAAGIYTINSVTSNITIQVEGVKEMPLTPTMKIQKFLLDGSGKVNNFTTVELDSFVKWGGLSITSAYYEYRQTGSSWIRLATNLLETGKKVDGKNQMNFEGTRLSGLIAGREYEVRLVVSDGTRKEESEPIAFEMPAKDKEPPKGAITGTVRTEEAGTDIAAEDELKTFSVSLHEGITSIAVLHNIGNGESFAFSELPDGEYNLVVRDEETQYQVTRMVTVEDGKTKVLGVIVVKQEKQTKVVVREGAPKVAVDQLNEVYQKAVSADTVVGTDAKDTQDAISANAVGGAILSLNLIAETSEEAEEQRILNDGTVTANAIAMSLNLTAELVKTDEEDNKVVTPIKDTIQRLLIAVPMDAKTRQLIENGTTLYVYREHTDRSNQKTIEKLEKLASKDDASQEGFFVDADAGYLYIRANKFSTYAVMYENSTPITPPYQPSTPSGDETGGGGGGGTKPKEPVTGSPQTFDKNDPKDIEITWEKPKEPKQVTVDDKPLDPKNYKSDDKTLTLPKEYLDALEPGEYTVIIYFDDDSAQKVVITIAGKQEPEPEPEPEPEKKPKPEKPTGDKGTKITVSRDFHRLPLVEAKATQNAVKVRWKKVSGADGYVLYGARCNTKSKTYKMKKLAVIKKGSKVTYTNRKLKSGTYYKYYIKAYKLVNGKKVWLAKSKTIHVTTTGSKYGNAKAVKVNKTKVTLKKGKTFVIKASQLPGSKPIKYHANVKFESTNKKIATVTEKGKIKAKKKGTCYIYAYAQNGVYKKIKVTVT